MWLDEHACCPVFPCPKNSSLLTEIWELTKKNHNTVDLAKKEINGWKLILWYAKIWKRSAQPEGKRNKGFPSIQENPGFSNNLINFKIISWLFYSFMPSFTYKDLTIIPFQPFRMFWIIYGKVCPSVITYSENNGLRLIITNHTRKIPLVGM